MASDVDQDKGDPQCVLKLYVRHTDYSLEDKPESKVKALYETLTEKKEYFTKHISTVLAKDGITLTNSHMTCNANCFIQFHWHFDRGVDRKKLNQFITNGHIENILTSFVDEFDIQSNISGSKEQKMNLDVRIQCDISEKSEKISETSKSTKDTVIQKVFTEQLPAENIKSEQIRVAQAVVASDYDSKSSCEPVPAETSRSETDVQIGKAVGDRNIDCDSKSRSEHLSAVTMQSEIQVQKAQAVGEASWDAESSCEHLEIEHTRSELKEEIIKTVSEIKFDSKRRNEQDLQKKNVRVYLDIKSKNVYKVEMEFQNEKRSLIKNKDTNIWQIDCSVSKNVHDSFFFHIRVDYCTKLFSKQMFASFSDYSKSPYIFVGLTTNGKSFEVDALCDFSVDIINDAPLNLRNALLQMEAMANQQNGDIQATESIKQNNGNVLYIDKILLNKNKKSLAENVKNKMDISLKSLMAFCYFLFVIKAENMNLKDLSAILDTNTGTIIVDACKCTNKDEIPPNCIEPILTIVNIICKLAYRTESSALFVINVVHKLANLEFLSKLIDEYKHSNGKFPLYLPTDQFKWKDMLHRMYAENPSLLKTIVQNLDREMLIEFLLLLYQKGIKNNVTVTSFEHILDFRNCAAVGRFGQSQGLHNVLSIWESTAKLHFLRSKKFVKECEKAILKSISDVSNVKRDNLDLLFKVLADDLLFLSQTLQCNLLKNLSELKTTETAKYFELLIQLLNSDKIPVSGEEHFHLIEQWFRSGLHMKPESKNEKNGSKLLSQTYLRLSQILQTKYVREHKDVNGYLENSVFDVIKEFKFKAFAKVLHEDVNSDVRNIFVAHIRKLLKHRCFESDANAIILDICENDILNVTKSETAEVVIAIVETMGIPRNASLETVFDNILSKSKCWSKILNVTGRKKEKIEEHELVKIVKKSIQHTVFIMQDKSITCKFLQSLEKRDKEVREISSQSTNLIQEMISCHQTLAEFQGCISAIDKILDLSSTNEVWMFTPISKILDYHISNQTKKISDGTLELRQLCYPSHNLQTILNIADICRRIELESSTCVFWNIVQKHFEENNDCIAYLQYRCLGFVKKKDLEQEEQNTLVVIEKIFCIISIECVDKFKHLWLMFAHDMNQNITDTLQVFQRVNDMESEIKKAEKICKMELPSENHNRLVRFSCYKQYKETVENIKIAAKSFKLEETHDSIYVQTVTKFEKMIERNFATLTLKEITPVLDHIHNIRDIINLNEDLSLVLGAINKSSALLDFLREVIDEDIRNLIDAVEEHSEQYVRESTVSNLIEVKRFIQPILKTNFEGSIRHLFKLLQTQLQESSILQIPVKIEECRYNLHSLRNLYRNVANRGEHTVELIDKIMLKGSFHLELGTKMCKMFVQYEYEKKDYIYKAADLNDLRSRALLIMNVDEKSKSDKKELRKEKLNKFVVLIDNAFEVHAICLKLKQAGHFGFASYEKKCGSDDMVALNKILQNQYDDWATEINAIRSRYYHMNFFLSNQLYELYMFLKGNTKTDTKILATVSAVLKYMGLSTDALFQIPMIYQKYTTPNPGDHTKALENIGKTLNFISQNKNSSIDHKQIADAQNASFIEKVQPGKPFFAWLDENSPLVIKVLLALYYNTTNALPLANQVLFCHEDTTFEEIDLLIRRCEESTEISQTKDLFSIVSVELLKREVQIILHDRLRNLSNRDFLLCFICRGNENHPFLDQFKESLIKLSPISETKMNKCFKTHCSHVLVFTSDVPGAGKSELIESYAIKDQRRTVTFQISGPFNRLGIIERLIQLKLQRYHALYIDIGTVSDPFDLDIFLFQLIVLGYVSAGSTAYALTCDKIYIEIANSIQNTLCDALSTVTSFQREHVKWKNYEDLKVSMEINSPMQVVCRFFKELDEDSLDVKDLYFNGPDAVKALTKSECKTILCEKFNASSDMSYTLVNVFIRVLADQLKKLSSSVFFQTSTLKAIMGGDRKPKVKSQIVKVLVGIAEKFSERSANTCRSTQSDFTIGNGEKDLNTAEFLAKRISGMIRWDESNHLMILFHKDIQTISAIYRHLHEVPESIVQLVESQTNKKLGSFDFKQTAELENLLIELTREPDKYVPNELAYEFRNTYVLTADNLLKMVLISLRINTMIPVIIMGETGCGKTSLLQYLSKMCGIEMNIFSIHAGTSEDEIYSRIWYTSQKALSNLNEIYWLFLDEINTCEHLGLLTSTICHRFCKDFKLAPNLAILAACNPYRLRREDSIHTTGLQGKIKMDNLSRLVYRVHPLPETMMDFVWDYGSLSQRDESAYIWKMVEIVKIEKDMPVEMLANALEMSQSFVREKERNDHCVSLRDVDRCRKLIIWLFDSFLKKIQYDKMTKKTRRIHSIILSLAICYQSRFGDRSIREEYLNRLSTIMSMSADVIANIITSKQEYILHKMEYLPEGTALNVALQENVFMLLVCILSKIPIFLVGKPGCSKSLSIQLLRSNLRGKDSANKLFKGMPQIFGVSFQGSESSTSEGIIKVFERAQKYQQSNDERDVLPVVILDEIGLAEISRFNPLKVLHEILEPGSEKHVNISVVGISNWALDAAKMSRAIHLSRPDMNLNDLMLTGQSICTKMMTKTANEVYSKGIAKNILDGIVSGYHEYFSRSQKFPNFHGLRDFYSLTKYIGRTMKSVLSTRETKMADEILIGILRNFGGLPTELSNILETFKKHVPCITVAHVPVMRLIRENIKDETSRHLMLITNGNVVISVLERELSEMQLPFDIIFGSNFEDDLNADYNYRILSRIILCMEQGMVLILKDLEAIYGSLYDMLNQSYTVVGKKKNCRVALGHYSNPMCHVHDDFKCIVLVEESKLDYSDPPFLNRFEKQHFQFPDLLKTEKLQTVVEEVTHEITSLCQIQNYSFIPEEVIPSYSFDLIVSLVVQMNQTVDEEHIKDYVFERLLWLMPPEVVIRALESKYAKSKQHFVIETIGKFMTLPIHGGICNFFQNFEHSTLKSRKTSVGSYNDFIECFIIYTHSSLHSIIEDQFNGHQVQKQKIATFKSEKEFTTSVENFLISDKSVFLLQCIAATEIQHTLLSKVIIEKAIRKCQQTCDNKHSTKYIYMIIHLDRGLHIHLPVNFLSSWNLLYMDSIQTPRTPLDYFLKVDKLEIVRERMPLHDYITRALFLVLSRVKFTSRDNSTVSLLEFLLKSLRSCKYAIDTLEEMIVSWIEKRTRSESSSEWCVDVAKSPHDLIISGTLIGAIENNIRDFIETPLSKYIFLMIDLNILTPVILEDEFTNLRRKSWKKCVLSAELLNIKNIPEPSGPECYSCSNRFLNLRMPYSQIFSETIENGKEDFRNIVRRRCIENDIEIDEEIPKDLFENEINNSFEIICYDAVKIESYPGQNDDYIHDFSHLFSSQFLFTDELNRMQIFKWALSNFLDLPVYGRKKFENLAAALHATLWVYGSVIKAMCLMYLEPVALLDLTYQILPHNEKIRQTDDEGNSNVVDLETKSDTEQDSESIRITDLDRQSFVRVICTSLIPTSTVLEHYTLSGWLFKVKQILPLAQNVNYESCELRCLKLCHEISESLFEHQLTVHKYIYQIADSLKGSNGAIDSPEVCNIIFQTLKELQNSNFDGRVLQRLFCSYVVRCLKTNSKNVYPFQFALTKIALNELFDNTLSYFGHVLKYAVALDVEEFPDIFLDMLSEKETLHVNVNFSKCLNECLLKLNHKLDVNMFLPVLVTDIFEYFAFSEDLSIDELKTADSALSEIFTHLTQAVNKAGKGICDINTLASIAYIRKFLKNAVVVLETWKYDCSDNLVFAQQINAVLCQREDKTFRSLLSSELFHLFLKIIEHVSGQENVEKSLRKLDKTITVLQNINWSNEIVEEMPVFNPLIMHAKWNESLLEKYQHCAQSMLADDKLLSDLLNNLHSNPVPILCVLSKQFYMKKCFRQLSDLEKRTAIAITNVVEKSDVETKVKGIIGLVLGQKDFKHSIFNLSEVVESPVPQIVSVMIHLSAIIAINNQDNTSTVWYKALFHPSSVKFELPVDVPLIAQHVLKLLCFSCFTCSYGFACFNAKFLENETTGNTENLDEYLRQTLEESWNSLHNLLEINYFDMCLLLHEIIFRSKHLFTGKTENYMQNFSDRLISEHSAIVADIVENRIEIIHVAKKMVTSKNGSELQKCVLNVLPCTFDVEFSNAALLLRLSSTPSKNMLLAEIQAGCKNQFKFLTAVVKDMRNLELPQHLSTLMKWHVSVVTFGTYKFRKVGFKDMTVSSFLYAFYDDSQRIVLENAFGEFCKSWNKLRSVFPSLKVEFKCRTALNLMHKNVTMNECTILENDSIFREVLECLVNIQNQFLKESSVKVPNEKNEYINSLSILDVRSDNLINFKWDEDWLDYCQCETRYGLGQKLNFYCDMIEKDMEQDMLSGKVVVAIPYPMTKIVFIDDLFQNCIELLKEISRKNDQKVLPDEIKNAIKLKASRDISHVSELLTHTGMTLSLLRKKGHLPDSGDTSIRYYLDSSIHITGMSSSVIHSLFPEEIRISHVVNLYQWLEELNGESIIETMKDEYRVKLSDNATQCLKETKQNTKHLEKLDHPLKVFAHRCLSITNNKIINTRPLNEYLANKDLWWQDDLSYDEDYKNGSIFVVADGIDKSLAELLSPFIMVENIYCTVQFLADVIKEAKQKEHQFSKLEQPKVEKQYAKREHGKQVIKKMKKRL